MDSNGLHGIPGMNADNGGKFKPEYGLLQTFGIIRKIRILKKTIDFSMKIMGDLELKLAENHVFSRGSKDSEKKLEKIKKSVDKRAGILYNATCATEMTDESGVWLSLARAPGLGPGGRRFESCHPDFAGVVQW